MVSKGINPCARESLLSPECCVFKGIFGLRTEGSLKRTDHMSHIVRCSMKTVSVVIFAFLLLFTRQALADYSYENIPAGYGLAWSDEFNGAVGSLPNSANWSYDTGINQPNNELENYTNSTNNVHVISDPNAVDGKSLVIIAQDPGGNNDQMGNYTSARIDTADKQTFTYGYMEARVRMSYGQGIWPAFWMLGNDINHGTNWPYCDEIDIMENIGNTGDQGTNHMSLHDGNDTTFYPALPGGQLYHNAYHTFAALWQPNQIQFFVDGNLMVTDTPASMGNNWAFNNNPNFFLLNCAVGGAWPGNPDSSTSFPQTMYVDYVRAYQTGFATPTPVVQSTWRVRCGGDNYTDSQGNLWTADSNFTGGWPAANTGTAVSGALPASSDGTLYQWERYGNTTGGQTLTYTFNVPTGSNYQVTMKFAEDYWTAAGQRLFNYAINGTTEATNFDIFANAGGQFKALDKVYNNITPNSNGQIVITLSPGSADNPKVDAIQVVPMAGGATNTATYTPTALATNTPTATATQVAGNSVWRVRAGGPAYTDSQGNVWAADENFTGGTAATGTNAISGALPNSGDQALYQDQRYASTFSYSFAVPTGSYQVLLKFAETYWTASGQRVFNVGINGSTVLTNFDIFATAGGANIAVDKVFNNISPVNGVITLNFGPASADQAMITAIQIAPQSQAQATPTRTFTATPTTGSSGGKLPYQVVGYCYTGNKASVSSLTGSGGSINWSTDVPWQDLTVAVDAFMIPNTNNTFSNGGAKNAALISAAHAHGVRCIVSIGGGGQDGAFPTVCTSANRQNFASAVTALIAQYGYDGADIDWESPNSAAQSDATVMMQDIYTKIKAMAPSSVDGLPRTLSFATVDYVFGIYNMTTLANYTDWLFYMGYDWYDCPNLYNGPLNLEKSGIASITNGTTWSYPINKVVLGCPLYTNDYNTSNCTASEYNVLSILHLGTPGSYNSTYAEQAYTAPNGHTVYVDTAQSYCDKINYAYSNHLKGIGMWDVGMALPYTDSAVSGIWNTIGAQASCLNIGPTATPTRTATPVIASTWRVNAGGPQYTDSLGNVWAADENFTGGTAAVTTSTITGALPTGAQTLYQSQRYGNPFSYSFNVPAGNYQVTLKFTETYWTAAGQRVFNVSVNGSTVLTNFDILKTAGSQNKAIDEVFNNIAPSGGTVTITLGPASVDNAMVDAIQIVPQPSTPTFTPSNTTTKPFTATNTVTSTQTSTMSSTMISTNTLTDTATVASTSTNTSTMTNTSTVSNTATNSSTVTAPNTATETSTLTPVLTSTPTNTNTAANTATSTNTAGNTATSTNTVINSATNTSTPPNTATNTNTALNTATSTSTSVNTATNTLTSTNTAPNTATSSNTPVNTATSTLSFTSTATRTNTALNTATATASSTKTWTAVFTNTSTPTLTLSPTKTNTFTFTATKTNTGTPTKTATPSGPCAGVPAWNGNMVYYAIGAKVTYNGELYQCIQAHTSLSTWMPSVTPALWQDLGTCGATGNVVQMAQVPGQALIQSANPKTPVETPQVPTSTPTVAIGNHPLVVPNPVTSDTANLRLPMTMAQDVSVKIYTVSMRLVQTVNYGTVNSGSVPVKLNDKNNIQLSNGLYYFRVQANGISWIVKVLVLR